MSVIFEDICFHNVSEIEKGGGLPGYILHRFPEGVRAAVAPDVADLTRGVELRFRLAEGVNALEPAIYLLARSGEGEAAVFFGDYLQGALVRLPCGVVTPVPIRYNKALDDMPRGRFANRLCRVFLNARAAIGYVGHEGTRCEPPQEGDEPGSTMVCYGSSITHGGLACANYNAFVQHAARRLGMDVVNAGMSGTCRAEAEMTEWLCTRDARVFVIELGANMLRSTPPEAFERRARAMLYAVARKKPDSLVMASTMLPRGGLSAPEREAFAAFNAALRQICAEAACPNLHLIEGEALLPDWTGLSADLTHPSDFGHALIGERLADAIRPLLRPNGGNA